MKNHTTRLLQQLLFVTILFFLIAGPSTVKVYTQVKDEHTLLDSGAYGPDFIGEATSSNLFGDGSDGDLIVSLVRGKFRIQIH